MHTYQMHLANPLSSSPSQDGVLKIDQVLCCRRHCAVAADPDAEHVSPHDPHAPRLVRHGRQTGV